MFPQLSENVANSVYWVGWSLFLLSAMAGLAGTILTLWGEKERERYSDIRLSDNERQIEVAKAQAATANESAAKANEGLAKSNENTAIIQKETEVLKVKVAMSEKDAALARIELEKVKELQRSRTLSQEQRASLTSKLMQMSGSSVIIVSIVGHSEAIREPLIKAMIDNPFQHDDPIFRAANEGGC